MVGVMLLANTLLGGSGMLGIPHAFSVAGWAAGLGLMSFSCIASAFGCHLLQCTARQIGETPSSFYTVARATVPRWTWLIDGAVAIKCFGVSTSYLIIVGDLLPDAAHFFGAEASHAVLRQFAVLFAFAVGGPLACLPNLSALRFTSLGSVSIVAWTALLIALFFFQVANPCAKDATFWEPMEQRLKLQEDTQTALLVQLGTETGSGNLPCDGAKFVPFGSFIDDPIALLKVFPVFIFGFTCHQNIFAICNEVRQATQGRVDKIIVLAYTIALCSFLCSAVLGYATYGQFVEGDVLMGYPQTVVVEVTRTLFSFVAIFSYPLQIHPARTCALNLWKFLRRRADGETGHRETAWRYWVVTAVLLIGSFSIAMVTSSLGVMLAIVGATGSTMVSYILPGLVYWCAFGRTSKKRYLALAQLCAGCIIMPACLTAAFL